MDRTQAATSLSLSYSTIVTVTAGATSTFSRVTARTGKLVLGRRSNCTIAV